MNIAIKVLGKIKNAVEKLITIIQRKSDPQFVALEKWYQEDPHNLRRSTFENLTSDSLVFDLGGYEGQWSSDLIARYNCNIFIFEPVKEYAEIIKERFKNNRKVSCFQFGLSKNNYQTDININEFASSTFNSLKSTVRKETITIESFNDFVLEQKTSQIDVMKINIEGGEYDLLENIISLGKIKMITHLLIQFHRFVPNADNRKKTIDITMDKTHEKVFDFPFVWELWRLRA